MKSRTTGIWFVIAAALFALCIFFNHHFRPPTSDAAMLIPNFQIAKVSAIQVDEAGATEIRVFRTNSVWQLEKPVVYPAQSQAVNSLLSSLQNLKVTLHISASEAKEHNASDTEYGFDSPQFSLMFYEGDKHSQLLVGNKTALGDQVYVRIVGMEGAYVTDAKWLSFLPHSADAWRDTSLVSITQSFDWIVITNGLRTIELRRDPATQLWRMLRPWPSRANSQFIDLSLQKLQAAQISGFVANTNKPDLNNFGLQPPGLDLWLGSGSNLVTCIHGGTITTNGVTGDFVQRDNWGTIGVVADDALAPWRSQVNDFRDPYLLELTQPVTEIDASLLEHYALQKQSSNTWSVVGQKYAADTEVVNEFVRQLAGLKVVEFVKDVATPVDLQGYGLASNSTQITVSYAIGSSNSSIQLIFGNHDTNNGTYFVRRADEESIYRVASAQLANIPEYAFELRDRTIWSVTGEDVTKVTIQQNGKTRVLIHSGVGKWALGPNSDGVIIPKMIEESIGGADNIAGLCQLSAWKWVDPGLNDSEKFGFTTNSLQITLELKNGDKHTVTFGQETPNWHSALASVNQEGKNWVFLFPQILYQFVSTYLTIPPDVP